MHTFLKITVPLLKFFEERGRVCPFYKDEKLPFVHKKGFPSPKNKQIGMT